VEGVKGSLGIRNSADVVHSRIWKVHLPSILALDGKFAKFCTVARDQNEEDLNLRDEKLFDPLMTG
jgi:hypothetical protein